MLLPAVVFHGGIIVSLTCAVLHGRAVDLTSHQPTLK